MSEKKSPESVKGSNIELRIILIGESGVGKKSIVERFKLLNCTKTIDTNLESQNKSKNENENENNSKNKDITQQTNTKTENEINTKTFTNSNTYATYTIKEETDPDDLEEIENRRRAKKIEEKRLSLMHFSKFYKINNDNFELFFFPCAEAQPLPYDYELKEEDEFYEYEKEYKLSIKKMIKELEKILLKQPENQNTQLEVSFFLCFDLSNMASFEKLVVYFSLIQKHFNLHFDQGLHLILIGNKVDKKKEMTKTEKNYLNQFLSRLKIPYYEISTLMFFKFENFFQKFLLENFSYIPMISDESTKQKFFDILTKNNNFSKSKRITFEENQNPGPNKYNSDIFSYPSTRRELSKIFSQKGKYKKKIFINKCGILFPPIQKNKDKENLALSNYKESLSVDKKKNVLQNFAEYENREKLKDFMVIQTKKPGYSIGGKTFQTLNLLQKRKELRNSRDLVVQNALAETGVIFKNSKSKKNIENNQEKYERNRIEKQQKFLDKLQKTQDNLKKRHDENNLKNSKIINDKIDALLDKEEKYQKLYDEKKKQMKISEYKNTLKNIHESCHEKKSKFPPGKFYDPLSSISLTRGFSFGLKLDKDKKNVVTPDFVSFEDDFDKIIKKNKNKHCIKSKSQRFPTFKTIEVGDSSNIMQKQLIFEKNRKIFKKDELNDFLENRKIRKEDVQRNKKSLEKEKQTKLKEQISKQYSTDNNYLIREINYDQVENSSPKYTMRTKYEFGSIFQKDKFNNDQTDLTNTFFNQEKKNKLFISELENPNIAVVRPKYPVFSFGNEKRFEDFTKKNDNKNNKFRYSNSESNFTFSDTKSFLKMQTSMGTSKKLEVKDNGNPGPGMYNIKGFAETVFTKGLEVDLARSKAREKERLEKIEKEKRDKLREQRLEEKKYELKTGVKNNFKDLDDNEQEKNEFQNFEKDNNEIKNMGDHSNDGN